MIIRYASFVLICSLGACAHHSQNVDLAGEWFCSGESGAISGARIYNSDGRFEADDNAALPDPDGNILDVALFIEGDWTVEDDIFIDSVTHIEINDTLTLQSVIDDPLVQLFETTLQSEFGSNPTSRSKISELTENKLALTDLDTGGTTVCERVTT